jgi:hypothetical protein
MHGREPDGGRADTDGRSADVALPQVPGVDDPAVLDLDERPQLVGLAEAIRRPEVLEVLEDVGRWLVVVGDAQFERDLRRSSDRLRRDPGHRGDGRLEAADGHEITSRRDVTDGAPRRCADYDGGDAVSRLGLSGVGARRPGGTLWWVP